jgi:hypothetical protein
MRSDFSFDEVFAALKINNPPQLIFKINSAQDVKEWNFRLPAYRSNLIGTKLPHGALEHYQGVLRENCKRLLKGTAAACKDASAIFQVSCLYDDDFPDNAVGKWLADGSSIPRLGIAGVEEIASDIMKDLLKEAKPFLGQGQEAGPFVAKAEGVALPAEDRKQFEQLLKRAIDISQQHRSLQNEVMRERALWLLSSVDDLF